MSSGIKQPKGSRTISNKDIQMIARALGLSRGTVSPKQMIGDVKQKPPVAKSRLTEEGKKLVKNKKDNKRYYFLSSY